MKGNSSAKGWTFSVAPPDNNDLALCRLMRPKRKLKHINDFLKDYVAFMNELLNRGYAEEVPCQDLNFSGGGVWYIPHQGCVIQGNLKRVE